MCIRFILKTINRLKRNMKTFRGFSRTNLKMRAGPTVIYFWEICRRTKGREKRHKKR